MKLLRHLANLGYGSRREVAALFRSGRVTDLAGQPLDEDDRRDHADVRLDGEPLDPAPGMVLMMHKPLGATCSTKDAGRLVYQLLPPRFRMRKPALSTVGRLDRDTSGLLLFTDDGTLLHRIISPRAEVSKRYAVTLAQDLRGDEAALFAAGTLMLDSEPTPLLPAALHVLEPRRALLDVTEGRYHQVRRMFAATGNHVLALERVAVGALTLGTLAPGSWRELAPEEVARVFQPPPAP
ncbi:pseudouridine synthase [Coralloluteibacterium stylophorae]|uniref:Pseudouridine synthase n=1 Tax=Coralloluteibacterium stylophorae TaxID=1776034 RepID=A0A8J7VTJ6_9GAMM|nr:pseudouridine synthase [Coralloluteibacterium stylophorae]MBS7457967.1 rRNA pseudouridine synthase [Coralloluteibacterium stylophorae]